jgi:PBP1b-binding outer membrane lipoprotein LpoB
MRTATCIVLIGMLLAGCSEQTQQEAQEALSATGEAVKSAAEDTKENAQEAAQAIRAGVQAGKQELQDDDTPPRDAETAADGEQTP